MSQADFGRVPKKNKVHQRTLRFLFVDFRSFLFINKVLLAKGYMCLCDNQNNTWLLVHMKFIFSRSTRHLTRTLRSFVSYRVEHSKRNSVSTRAHVLFSI